MRLRRLRRRSGGVLDRRGGGSLGGFGSGSWRPGRGLPVPTGGGVGVVLLVVVAVFLLPRLLGGGDAFGDALSPFDGSAPVQPGSTGDGVSPDDPTGRFVDAVTDDIQTTWAGIFRRAGRTYEPTRVVLFDGVTRTGCGDATSSVGPFYCPADRLVYLDVQFFRELERRFGAPGDFAEAYVIAHEVGHHVQSLLGIENEVRRQAQEDPAATNDLSIRLELQADCLAGVWARAARGAGVLEAGDLAEGIAAAAAVGDDRIQEAATGRIDRESWTHGSSEQRVRWFRTGFQVGNPDACDTFNNDI